MSDQSDTTSRAEFMYQDTERGRSFFLRSSVCRVPVSAWWTPNPQVLALFRRYRSDYADVRQKSFRHFRGNQLISLVLPVRIELTTFPLPRECSTTELRQRSIPADTRRP
jgi:hypothetical protein